MPLLIGRQHTAIAVQPVTAFVGVLEQGMGRLPLKTLAALIGIQQRQQQTGVNRVGVLPKQWLCQRVASGCQRPDPERAITGGNRQRWMRRQIGAAESLQP